MNYYLVDLSPRFRTIEIKQYPNTTLSDQMLVHEVHFETGDIITLGVEHTGSAFQKVFTALILFFTLAENHATRKYFLVDDFGAHLDNDDAEKFFECLLKLSQLHNIKLIATTRPIIITQ